MYGMQYSKQEKEKYGSSLEAALDGSKIPTEVYDNLIQTVHGIWI